MTVVPKRNHPKYNAYKRVVKMSKKRKARSSFIPTLTNQQHTQSRQSEVPTLTYRKGKKEMLYLFHNIKPKLFSPKNIPNFEKFEQVLKKLELLEFTRIEFDPVIRIDFLVDLVSNYSPEKKDSFVSGCWIDVSKKYLAKALKLPVKKPEKGSARSKDEVGLDNEVYSDEEISFIEDFVRNRMLVCDEHTVMPSEIVEWTRCIRAGHPEKMDAAQLIWYQVEKELTQGEKLVECYYASHLQCLIKSQCPFLFEETEEEEAKDDKDESVEHEKKLKTIIESKDQELETKHAEVVRLEGELVLMSDRVSWLEGALQSNRTKFANYRERYHVREKPLYQDAGRGGLVLSTRETEAQKQKQEEDMTKEVAAQLKETRKLQKSLDKNEHDVSAEIEENQKSLDGNDADEAKEKEGNED